MTKSNNMVGLIENYDCGNYKELFKLNVEVVNKSAHSSSSNRLLLTQTECGNYILIYLYRYFTNAWGGPTGH